MPGFIFLMPNYLMMDQLGWLDTLLALIVPGAAGAFGVFFLRQFFLAIPRELEESALIDGANTWQILTRIILPDVEVGAGHAGRALLPRQLERLHLAGLRAVLAGTADPARRVWRACRRAYNIDYPVVMAGATIAVGAGADPLHLRPALHHRRCGRHSGLKG